MHVSVHLAGYIDYRWIKILMILDVGSQNQRRKEVGTQERERLVKDLRLLIEQFLEIKETGIFVNEDRQVDSSFLSIIMDLSA